MVYAPSGSGALNEFWESVHFSPYGKIPRYFQTASGPVDAIVWLTVLNGKELIEYVNPDPDPEALVDLSSPTLLSLRKKHMPKWLRDFLLQFVLPFGVVGLVFLISYLLVLFGPLKGISSEGWLESKSQTTHTTPSVGHTFDHPDEYDEL